MMEGPGSRKADALRRVVLLVLAAFACGEGPHAASLPGRAVPQSLGMNLQRGQGTDGYVPGIDESGARFVRKAIGWAESEKAKGVYDFGRYDPLIEDLHERGMGILAMLNFNNELYPPAWTPAGRKPFADYASAAAKHFKGRNMIWEIWNEPNTRAFWRRDGKPNSEEFAAEYTALVKEVVPAMRKADPDCFVVAGSVSCLWWASYEWTESCFRQGILESGINGWSVHPYNFSRPAGHVEAYARVRELLAKYGAPPDFPLLNSERGFPVKKTEGWAGGDPSNASQQLQYQAWHFVRQYLVDLMCDVRLTIWYQWAGAKFGMVHGGTKRPAYEACKVMVSELSGYQFRERLPADSPLDFLLLFEKEPGEQKLVAWTAPPPKQSPDKAQVHDVDVPVIGSGSLAVCDVYGEKRYVNVTDGTVTLTLSGAPQYVALRGGRKSASPPERRSKRVTPKAIAKWDAKLPARVKKEAVTAKRKPRSRKPAPVGEPPVETPKGSPEARCLLKEAETLFIDGDLDGAGAVLEKIMREHGGTSSAAKAREYVELLE